MFYKDKTVVVTGGTGFVGTHFVEGLLRRESKVRVPIHERPLKVGKGRVEEVPADLNRLEECLKVMEGVDYVFHLAGAVTNAANDAPIDHIVTNLILTSRVLQAAWRKGIDRILIFGSHTSYPPFDHPVKEEELWKGEPHECYFGYGWMRRYLERIGEFTASKSKTKVAIVRPSATYGPWDNFDLATSHVIPALIRKAVERWNPYEVWGSGEEIRDFLHVGDLVRGCLSLLERYPEADPVNIGYGRPVKIKEVVQIVLKAAGHKDAKIKFQPSKPIAIPIRMVDTSKAKALLDFEPEVSLEEGLTETVKWYSDMKRFGYVR